MFNDSVDKIIQAYFAAVTRAPFAYKGKAYFPHDLRVSPGMFRGYTCPPNCGACCHRFSLDYLPAEPRPDRDDRFREREVEFNGKLFTIISDTQEDHEDRHCINVNKQGDGPQRYDDSLDLGRCQVHGKHPFTCDFELLRFTHHTEENPDRPNYLNQRLYGRGWAMTRVTGEKKAMCEMITGDMTWKADTMRRLARLMEWADYFQLDHCLLEIIGWVATGPHEEPLTIKNTTYGGRHERGEVTGIGEGRHKVRV